MLASFRGRQLLLDGSWLFRVLLRSSAEEFYYLSQGLAHARHLESLTSERESKKEGRVAHVVPSESSRSFLLSVASKFVCL